MNDSFKFYARRDHMFGETIELFAWLERDGKRRMVVAQPTVMMERKEEDAGFESKPWAVFGRDSMQRLMDELWNVGLRPTEGTGSAGSLAATERHLTDMRALVFKTEVPK